MVIAEGTRQLVGSLFELEVWAALHPSSVESRFEALRTTTVKQSSAFENGSRLDRRRQGARPAEPTTHSRWRVGALSAATLPPDLSRGRAQT